MAKVRVANFYGDSSRDKGNLKHNSIVCKEQLFEIAKEANDYGLHIMIRPVSNTNDEDVTDILFYSARGFSQR